MADSKYPTVGPAFATSETSITILRTLLPAPAWILREHRPDFHIDYLLEPTVNGELSGINVGIQLKGWTPKKQKLKVPVYRLETKHLLYYLEKCEFPIFLLVVDVVHRVGYWVFTQQFGSKLNRDELRKRKKVPISFSADDNLADLPRFTQAIKEAVKFMHNLRPGSIDAAVLQQKKELEATDPRVEVQIDVVNGRTNFILNPKQELPFSVGFNTKDPKTIESIRDFFEKGTDLTIKREEIDFKGSPLFEVLQGPKGEKLRIQYRRETDGHALFSWGESDPEAHVFVPGKCRIGEKSLTFEGNLPGSPFAMSTSVPWTMALTREAFWMSFEFHPQRWQNQRLVALPHFESIHRFFKAVLGGKPVELRLYCQGNLLGASKLDRVDTKDLQGALALLDTLRKARVLAVRFHLDPVLPEMKKSIEPELVTVDEVYALLECKEWRSRIPGVKGSFTSRKPPGEEDFDRAAPLRVVQDILGYKIFGQPVMVGSAIPGKIQAELTNLKIAQVTPLEDTGLFKIELRSSDESERVVRYQEGAPSEAPTGK